MQDDDVILCHCKKCNTDKPLEQFYDSLLNRRRTEGTCIVCWNLYTAERRRARDIKKALQTTKLSPVDPLILEMMRYLTELGAFVRTIAAVNRIEDMAPRMPEDLQAMFANLPKSQARELEKAEKRGDAVRRRALDEGRTPDGGRPVAIPAFFSDRLRVQAEAIFDPEKRRAFIDAEVAAAFADLKGDSAALQDTQAAPKRAPIAEAPTLRRPSHSQATTQWPKRASDVTEQELQAHVEHLKALIEASEASPLQDFPTPRGTTMRGGKEFGADGTLVATELDPVYQTLSRERSKPDSLDGF